MSQADDRHPKADSRMRGWRSLGGGAERCSQVGASMYSRSASSQIAGRVFIEIHSVSLRMIDRSHGRGIAILLGPVRKIGVRLARIFEEKMLARLSQWHAGKMFGRERSVCDQNSEGVVLRARHLAVLMARISRLSVARFPRGASCARNYF